MEHPAETLHGFLTAWLTVHILGEDQAMARQIRRIQAGRSADEAYAEEKNTRDPINAILLEALERLYQLLSQQNHNLAESNNLLEQRVRERTQALSESNTRLEQQHQALAELLKKVEDAQQQLLQSEKMAAIGQLAAGVAHEINNPVGFVNSNLGTLKTYIDRLMTLVDAYEKQDANLIAQCRQAADIEFLREDLPSLVDESREGLSRVTKIVQDLKDFSRVDQAAVQPANLNAALESTLNVVWNELKYKADIVRELGDLPDIVCVPAQINQVFMNLLVNAAQAIPQHGTITLRSGLTQDHAWFEIEDNGCGMSEAVQKRIFEPFYTTKPVGKGTGLGLSISYDIIVKKHHGQMYVRSTPGQGTCFRISLPLLSAAVPT
jgi:signal transduction histidine kinase